MATSGCSWHPPTASPCNARKLLTISSSPPHNILPLKVCWRWASGILLMFVRSDQIRPILIKLLARSKLVSRHLMSAGRISISCGIGAHEHVAQNGTIVPFNRNQVATPGCADGFSEFEKMDSLFLVFSSQHSYQDIFLINISN